ncbi:hypothetical protein KFE25_005968 [Diacronema lutheri]|uniref:Protein TIC 20 n=2 Tax=Diacronema lutheri TaxID=2081491 RepID=A0A8J5XQ34_DIALT|nr:hypothetical protein KFE25_005968 [Diacronema lutheri]
MGPLTLAALALVALRPSGASCYAIRAPTAARVTIAAVGALRPVGELTSTACLGRAGRTAPRSRARLSAESDEGLRAQVAQLRDETRQLRSEVQEIQELNELAKPRRPPPPPPPARAPPPPTPKVSNLDLPFGIRIEAGVEQSEDGRPARRPPPDDEGEPLFQLDLETTRLQPVGRLVSTLPYLMPLLDGAVFAPPHEPWIGLLQLAQFYYAIPFGTIVLFIIFSRLSQNFDLPFAVRYNLRQAVMLDIAISIPSLLGALVGAVTNTPSIAGAQEVQTFIFYVALGTVLYCQVCNLVGVLPKGIPFISENADKSSGPRW